MTATARSPRDSAPGRLRTLARMATTSNGAYRTVVTTNSQRPYWIASSNPPPDARNSASAASLSERGVAHGAGGADHRPAERGMQHAGPPRAGLACAARTAGRRYDQAARRDQAKPQPPHHARRQVPDQVEPAQEQHRQRPGHRVHDPQVAGAVAQGQPQEVDRLRAARPQQERPYEGQDAPHEQLGPGSDEDGRDADREQDLQERRPRVAALLGDQVPAGVQDRREQDDADGERRHALISWSHQTLPGALSRRSRACGGRASAAAAGRPPAHTCSGMW